MFIRKFLVLTLKYSLHDLNRCGTLCLPHLDSFVNFQLDFSWNHSFVSSPILLGRIVFESDEYFFIAFLELDVDVLWRNPSDFEKAFNFLSVKLAYIFLVELVEEHSVAWIVATKSVEIISLQSSTSI